MCVATSSDNALRLVTQHSSEVMEQGILVRFTNQDKRCGMKTIDEAVKLGIIDLEDVAQEIERMNRERILAHHSIWQGKNGYYYVKLNGKLIKKNTKQKVEDAIIDAYEVADPSVRGMFNQFLKHKRNHVQDMTIKRYEVIFRSYLKPLANIKLKNITEWDVEKVLNDILKRGIKAKEFAGVRTVLYGIFKLAKKQGFIDFRITELLEDMNISPKEFKPKDRTKQVLTDAEYQMTIEYLISHQDIRNLGILLIMVTGLRIGELCGLKTRNIHEDYVVIDSMEVRKFKGYEYQDRVKCDSNRKVYVPPNYKWLLKKIRLEAELKIYVYEGINQESMRFRWRKIQRELGLEHIGLHKLRKTYASRLYDSGASKFTITSQLGHRDFNTTLNHYIKSTKTDSEIKEQIKKVT